MEISVSKMRQREKGALNEREAEYTGEKKKNGDNEQARVGRRNITLPCFETFEINNNNNDNNMDSIQENKTNERTTASNSSFE